MSESHDPFYFDSPAAFRKWLQKNHRRARALWVGFYKAGSGKRNMTWDESVDEALCFGWIDGLRRSVDHERFIIRFTPRKPSSTWSAVNIAKMDVLTKKGLMRPAGLAVFRLRRPEKSRVASFEQARVAFAPAFTRKFRANKKAWAHFQSRPPSYRKQATHWVMSAKREETRLRRLALLIKDSEKGRKIRPLNY